ncbi:MAG: hypothetical protein NC418_06255 [Muribaculaceae bacterium]|nr:hypothetical protein [Muribaculaceae bacterium]
MKKGNCTLVYIDAEIYPHANGVFARNLAPKYNGPRSGWYGARELKHDTTHNEFIYIVYDFDYYAANII